MAALAERLGPVSVPAGTTGRHRDAVIEVDGRELNVSFKTTAYATTSRFEQMKRDDVDSGDGAVLVVADRINAPARQAIEDMGWGSPGPSSWPPPPAATAQPIPTDPRRMAPRRPGGLA